MIAIVKKYKYFIIGGIMGIVQQYLGRLDYYLYKGRDVFSFSAIMGGLSLYAFIIFFVMQRKKPPVEQFRDLFLFFLGLDLFYYLYVFAGELIAYQKLSEHEYEWSFYFQETKAEIRDFIKWTLIGTASGVWAYFAARSRDSGKTAVYTLMVLPLAFVVLVEFLYSAGGMYHYLMQEHNRSHGGNDTVGVFYSCPAAELLTSAVCLALGVWLFFRREKLPAAAAEENEA